MCKSQLRKSGAGFFDQRVPDLAQMNQKTVTYQKTVDISAIKNKNLFIKFYGSARNTQVFVDNQ